MALLSDGDRRRRCACKNVIARRPDNGMSRLCSAHWIAAISPADHSATTEHRDGAVPQDTYPRLAPRAPAVGPCDARGSWKNRDLSSDIETVCHVAGLMHHRVHAQRRRGVADRAVLFLSFMLQTHGVTGMLKCSQ